MVLQQEAKVPIWGTADPGEKIDIAVESRGMGMGTGTAAGKDGKWIVFFDKLRPGGPYTLTVKGTNQIVVKNIVVGEVWVCGGQSNMEWPMTLSRRPKEDIAAAKHPEIRLFRTPKAPASTTQTAFGKDIHKDPDTGKWQECSPESVAKFS